MRFTSTCVAMCSLLTSPSACDSSDIIIMIPYSLKILRVNFHGLVDLAVLWIKFSWIVEVLHWIIATVGQNF